MAQLIPVPSCWRFSLVSYYSLSYDSPLILTPELVALIQFCPRHFPLSPCLGTCCTWLCFPLFLLSFIGNGPTFLATPTVADLPPSISNLQSFPSAVKAKKDLDQELDGRLRLNLLTLPPDYLPLTSPDRSFRTLPVSSGCGFLSDRRPPGQSHTYVALAPPPLLPLFSKPPLQSISSLSLSSPLCLPSIPNRVSQPC